MVLVGFSMGTGAVTRYLSKYGSERVRKAVQNATLKVYPGAPHELIDTHKEQLNSDLLAFLKR
jgi:pimeloyl-ACP methyl ester carboxylesterase